MTAKHEDTTDQQAQFKRLVQLGLLSVAAISVGCALLHGLYPALFDVTTAKLLGVAIAALVIQQVTRFKGFGIEVELEHIKTAIAELEKSVGPGSKTAAAPPGTPTVGGTPVDEHPLDPDDPNKGRFGRLAESNGRQLSATIQAAAGPESSRCRVIVKVVSTDPGRPLVGTVKLHLHPTFGQWASYDLDVTRGVAKDTIVSYGAFTIGAEADNGETRLELDLADVSGGTKRFYEE